MHILQKSQGLATLFKHLSDDQAGSDKWESVRRAADAIIQEKDIMIDKLVLLYYGWRGWGFNDVCRMVCC